MLYPAMRQVAATKGLTITEQARFHAMTSMTGADSLINCWAEKAHWNFWRPITAIHLADTDGNDATDADTGWASLGALPPYADEPSGANCVYSGVMNSREGVFRQRRSGLLYRWTVLGGIDAELQLASPRSSPT